MYFPWSDKRNGIVVLRYSLVTVIDRWYCGAHGTTTALHRLIDGLDNAVHLNTAENQYYA
jgi:hypothetical protein